MPASNGVFGASGALSRVDRYFAIFAARLALKDCWEAPPAAKPQIVSGNRLAKNTPLKLRKIRLHTPTLRKIKRAVLPTHKPTQKHHI